MIAFSAELVLMVVAFSAKLVLMAVAFSAKLVLMAVTERQRWFCGFYPVLIILLHLITCRCMQFECSKYCNLLRMNWV